MGVRDIIDPVGVVVPVGIGILVNSSDVFTQLIFSEFLLPDVVRRSAMAGTSEEFVSRHLANLQVRTQKCNIEVKAA